MASYPVVAVLGTLLALSSPLATPDPSALLERARAAAHAGGSRTAAFHLTVATPTWHAERWGHVFTEDGGAGDRNTLVVFEAPAQVSGVKLLSRRPREGPAQQWLYTPTSHRARRIVPGESGRSVFGSDFVASDLDPPAAGGASRLVRHDQHEGHDVWVVEVTHADLAGATDEMVWIRTDDSRIVRREFYTAGAVSRTYAADVLTTIDGIATPVAMTLVNVAAGTRSRVELREVRYHLRLDPALFTVQQLDSRVANLGVEPEAGSAR